MESLPDASMAIQPSQEDHWLEYFLCSYQACEDTINLEGKLLLLNFRASSHHVISFPDVSPVPERLLAD